MKKKSLEILYRYRCHLLEREQILLQDKIAAEAQQKTRLLGLQTRVKQTHEAKSNARTPVELSDLDDSASYLHMRMTLARRALALSGQEREEALQRTLRVKQSRDQVAHLIEHARRKHLQACDENERHQIDEMVTARYTMNRGEL